MAHPAQYPLWQHQAPGQYAAPAQPPAHGQHQVPGQQQWQIQYQQPSPSQPMDNQHPQPRAIPVPPSFPHQYWPPPLPSHTPAPPPYAPPRQPPVTPHGFSHPAALPQHSTMQQNGTYRTPTLCPPGFKDGAYQQLSYTPQQPPYTPPTEGVQVNDYLPPPAPSSYHITGQAQPKPATYSAPQPHTQYSIHNPPVAGPSPHSYPQLGWSQSKPQPATPPEPQRPLKRPHADDQTQLSSHGPPRSTATSSEHETPAPSKPKSTWEVPHSDTEAPLFARPEHLRRYGLLEHLCNNYEYLLTYFPRDINGLNLAVVAEHYSDSIITKAINRARDPGDHFTEEQLRKEVAAAFVLYSPQVLSGSDPFLELQGWSQRRRDRARKGLLRDHVAFPSVNQTFWAVCVLNQCIIAVHEYIAENDCPTWVADRLNGLWHRAAAEMDTWWSRKINDAQSLRETLGVLCDWVNIGHGSAGTMVAELWDDVMSTFASEWRKGEIERYAHLADNTGPELKEW